MCIRSDALFSYLVCDISKELPTVPFEKLILGRTRGLEWPGIAPREVACLALLDSILKKFGTSSEDANQAALTKFLACNSRCESFSAIDESSMTEIQAIALGEFKKCFHDFWIQPNGDYWINPSNISEGISVGPGSSVGVTGTSYYQKIASGKMTGTRPSLFSLYQREASRCTLWDETEKIRSNHLGGYVEVKGSRLSFVPKNSEISRTICTEPLLNMLFQKGLGSLFESELKRRFSINLSLQPDKNRELARIGSESGALGTIDLSSASDSISLNLLRQICPPYVLSWMMETRSSSVTLPKGESLKLHMVSSMGNAFTFPLQTILFSSVVFGVYRALGIKLVRPLDESVYPSFRKGCGNYAVFGDDIIVRREAYDLVVNLLTRIGFSVNTDKSFNSGPFRESCGADFWRGYNVRGVYCQSITSQQDVYSLINRLNVWSANHAVLLPETIGYLKSLVGFLPTPPWESDVSGIKVPYDIAAPSQHIKRDKWTGSIVYKRYLSKQESLNLLSVESRPQVLRKGRMIHNPSGILLSAVGGYLRDGNLLLRTENSHYQRRFAIAPCWDYRDPCRSTLTSDGWRRWKSFYVGYNLGS